MPVLFSNLGATGTAIAAAALALTGHAPTLGVNRVSDPTPASVTATGYAPRAYVPGTMAMGPGLLFGLNLQSDQSGIRTPAVGSVVAAGYVVTLINPDAAIETLGSDDLNAVDATVAGTAVRILPTQVERYPGKGTGVFSGKVPVISFSGIGTLAGTGSFSGSSPALGLALAVVGAPPTTGTATVYASSFITGTVLTPANALGASDGTFTTNTGSTSWSGRWRMGTVGDSPSGTHSVSFRVRKSASGGATPTLTAELWQANALLSAIGATPFSVTSATGEDYSLTFDSALLTGFGDVDFRLNATGAGGGPNRRTAQLDSITWTALYESGTANFSGYAPDKSIAPSPIILTATPGSGTSVFEGFEPGISTFVSTVAGSGTFAGSAPSLSDLVALPARTGTFAGSATSLLRTLITSAGAATATGYAPFPSGVSSTIDVPVGSGAFSGYASRQDRSLNVPQLLVHLSSSFNALAEVRPLTKGTGTFSGKVPEISSTGETVQGPGTLTSRRATVNGTVVRLWQDDAALVSPVATMSGAMVNVIYGSGVLNSLVATVNRAAFTGGGNLVSPVALVWGGAIHRPYLRINQVDVDVDANEVNVGLSAYSDIDIQLSQGAQASVG